jgi:mono/diheme cytochrome c family protein
MRFNPGKWPAMGACAMRCLPSLRTGVMALMTISASAALPQSPAYNLGRSPTEEETRAWDIAIGPAGKELPAGSGSAKEGAKVYAQKCAACHGATGTEQQLLGPRLIGGKIGSYWPFATTIWDYINRAMPRNKEGSLKPDEVYAVTAFLLYKSGIIKESDVMNAESLPRVRMPHRSAFVPSEPVWKPGMKRPYGYYPNGN